MRRRLLFTGGAGALGIALLHAASLRRLAEPGVRTILPGHGDPPTDGAAEKLRALAATA